MATPFEIATQESRFRTLTVSVAALVLSIIIPLIHLLVNLFLQSKPDIYPVWGTKY